MYEISSKNSSSQQTNVTNVRMLFKIKTLSATSMFALAVFT